jgi:ABC-type branched-subunit amino acid transport system substrate-binding protein
MIRIAPSLGPLALVLALCFGLMAGCAGLGGLGERVPEAQRQAYAAALALGSEGSTAASSTAASSTAAKEALEAFLIAYPKSSLGDNALEELARLEFLDGGREAAIDHLRQAVVQFPQGDRTHAIGLRLALWESDRGNDVAARGWLAGVDSSHLTPGERRFYYRLRVSMAQNDVARLIEMSKLRAATAEELAPEAADDSSDRAPLSAGLTALDREIDTLLLGLSGEDLLRAIPSLGVQVPAARVRLVLSWRALVGGDLELATFWLEDAGGYAMTPADSERMRSLAVRLGSGDGETDGLFLPTFREAAARPWPALEGLELRVGVVLPLTGRYASFGDEVLRGLLLAAGAFNRELPLPEVVPTEPDPLAEFLDERIPPESRDPGAKIAPPPARPPGPARGGIQLVVRDSGGSPERAAAAVRELAADAKVLAIVGPIFSAESEAAAQAAEEAQIPLLTLSNRMELGAERDYVFRLRMTPDDEIDRLVEYAMDEVGAQTFAILYPMSRYGRGMRSRYWEAVVDRGGKVVAAAGYEPDATDFKAPIRGMVGFDLITRNERVALRERSRALRRGRRLEPEAAAQLKEILYTQLGPEAEPLPPVVDFDALFIPDGHDKIQLIAPQLAFHEVEGVQLLGSSDWNDPELIEIGRDHVTGALISTPFYAGSDFEIVRNFVTSYRESFGSEPDEFSASAFDALNIVLTQAALKYDSRLAVRDGILRIYGFPGVSGVTSILPDGNARKRPFLLKVMRRRFVGID